MKTPKAAQSRTMKSTSSEHALGAHQHLAAAAPRHWPKGHRSAEKSPFRKKMHTYIHTWHQPRSRAAFQDLLEDISEQDFWRITVLYISRATRTPDAPGNEPQLQRRQRDSALTAWERAKQFQDHKQTEWQEVLDSDHKVIYTHAVQRLAKIYDDPQHFIHQKAPRHQGKHTKQYKRDLMKQCGKVWADNHHRWDSSKRVPMHGVWNKNASRSGQKHSRRTPP